MDPATRALLNSIVLSVIGSALAFMAAMFWHRKNAAEKEAEKIAAGHALLMARVTELESQNKLMQAAVVPISTAFQAILIKELTHYHTPEMDALMVNLGPPNTLTTDEEARLIELLKQRSEDMDGLIPQSERDAADMLPMVMKRVKHETETAADPSDLQLVKVPVAAPETPTE